MPLASGTRLGPYEVLAPIGAGGMGEVYQAKDTRLDRTVAIKVLPEHLSKNAELRQRFEQEARAVSSLNHPHICTLHDVGHENGIDFLVMEYIEGESLADVLAKGPLPLELALTYGIQICDALDKAHGHGIVHRDLKPGNIIITKSGAKLLDFGLAKLQQRAAEPDLSAVTQQKPLTQQGAILGTFQYMAPEQLEGGEADARTDLFAFGAVLYEMITGEKAFEGKSQASLIHAIMGVDPAPVSTIVTTSPPALDHVIKSCLAKDPDERSQSAGEVGRNLRWIRDAGHETVVPATSTKTSKWERLAWAVALLVTAIAVWALTRPAPPRVVRMTIVPPASEPLEITGSHTDVAFTPDGSSVVYTATSGRMLYVRALDQLEASPLRNTLSGRSPFVSPDGAWIAFMSNHDDTIKKVSIHGGPAVTICPVTQTARGGSWGDDDTIVFSDSRDGGLFVVPAAGGKPTPLTTPADGDSHRFPDYLPAARAVLFTIVSGDGPDATSQIAVLDRESGEHKTLTPGSSARYVEIGHIVYVVDGTLLAARFDLASLELESDPVPVLEGVDTKNTHAGNFSVSRDGSLVYVPGGQARGARVLTWDYRNGDHEPLNAPPRGYTAPRISPDGSRVAFYDSVDGDIWIWDFERETTTRLTFDPGYDHYPIWTPDGERIIFQSNRGGEDAVYARASDGTGDVERVTAAGGRPRAVSPDGKLLVFTRNADGGQDLYVQPLEENGPAKPLVVDSGVQAGASISPDGRWIAYMSQESGTFQIYVRPFPDPNEGRWMVSTDGGEYPVWAPDSREIIYFEDESGRLHSVEVEAEPTFTPGRSKPLPYAPNHASVQSQTFDVHPDGQKFLSLRDSAVRDGPGRHLVVVLNWAEELTRLVP